MLARAIQAVRLTLARPAVAYVRGLDLIGSLRHSPVARVLGTDEDRLREIVDEFEESVGSDLDEASRGNAQNTQFGALCELYSLVRITGAGTIVETGVAGGFSTTAFLAALEANGEGKLYSIDAADRSKVGWAVPHRLRGRWDLRLGTSKKILPPLLDELGSLDIFMHDSDHTYETMMFEFETAWPRIRSAGLLVSDDIHWTDAFFEFSRTVRRHPIFFDPRRSAVIRK